MLNVLFGLSLLLGHWRRRRRVPSVATDDFDLIGSFDGSEQRVASTSFRGGSATAVFGGVAVDLRALEDERPRRAVGAEMKAQPDLIVTGFVSFGGISIK